MFTLSLIFSLFFQYTTLGFIYYRTRLLTALTPVVGSSQNSMVKYVAERMDQRCVFSVVFCRDMERYLTASMGLA